ncbi:MAG TPA: ATP-binding protein [Terriglobales bacterium]|nr:ATP-binding protein [Terriglobales bacterium]
MKRKTDANFSQAAKRRLRQPCLILLMGVAGSGKTTLAREILRHLWAVYLDNNHIVDAFFADQRNGRAYEKLRPRFYRALYTIAEENLKTGNSVLLDVPHMKEMQIPEWRRFIQSLAARTKSKLVIVRCRCPENVLRMRLEGRGEKRDRWKLKHWREFLAEQPIDLPLVFSHLDIDTTKELSKNVKLAVQYITGHDGSRAQRLSSVANSLGKTVSARGGPLLSASQL